MQLLPRESGKNQSDDVFMLSLLLLQVLLQLWWL